MLVRGVYNGNLEEADNSIAIVYMVFNVICLEFGVQKSRVDRLKFQGKRKNEEVSIIVVTGMYLCNSLLGAKWQAHNRDGICD